MPKFQVLKTFRGQQCYAMNNSGSEQTGEGIQRDYDREG